MSTAASCAWRSAGIGSSTKDKKAAVRAIIGGFPADLVEELARLPDFRNVVIHDYVGLDYEVVVAALDRLEPIRHFIRLVARRVTGD